MTRQSIGLTSNRTRVAPWVKRVAGLGALGVSVAAMTALYACSGDDNSITAPPVNDSGPNVTPDGSPDGGPITNNDGGPNTTPDGGDGGPPPACSSLPGQIVYIESGDTQQPLLKALGRHLRDEANVTIVYQLTGSCTLTPNLYSGVAIPANTNMLYIPSTAENGAWTTANPESTCTTSAATPPDLGISALFTSSCASAGAQPAGIGTWNGPTQAYTFIVPSTEYAGGQTSIQAEEAYYALGDGANNPVTFGGNPEWNVPAQFFLRPQSKSTLVATAKNIHLTAVQAIDGEADGGTADGRQLLATSSLVLSGVAASTSAQALGILGDEVYDANRTAGVKVLAFRAFNQGLAFYPDSTETAFDKQNIRDGHYSLWSPTVYIAPQTGNVPTNPTVKFIVDTVLGNPGASLDGGTSDAGAPVDGLKLVVGAGLTPTCAMQVQRSGDGKDLSLYTPAAPCTCKFLSEIPGATSGSLPASCTTCGSNADCTAAGTLGCFNGYCESPVTPPAATDGGACGNTCIINATTTAISVDKAGVVLPPLDDGGLDPVSP